MYGISPEDRLWLVKRDHDQRRHDAATERMVAATGREGDEPATTGTPLPAVHPRRTWIGHLLPGFALGHRRAHHGVAH